METILLFTLLEVVTRFCGENDVDKYSIGRVNIVRNFLESCFSYKLTVGLRGRLTRR